MIDILTLLEENFPLILIGATVLSLFILFITYLILYLRSSALHIRKGKIGEEIVNQVWSRNLDKNTFLVR